MAHMNRAQIYMRKHLKKQTMYVIQQPQRRYHNNWSAWMIQYKFTYVQCKFRKLIWTITVSNGCGSGELLFWFYCWKWSDTQELHTNEAYKPDVQSRNKISLFNISVQRKSLAYFLNMYMSEH